VGGSNKFIETSFSSKHYFGFGEDEDIVFNPQFTVSRISGYSNKQVPMYRRFSLGGIGSMRGFDSLGISLRDPVTGDAVGGDKTASMSMNLFFPLPYMQTAGIRGLVFGDAGTVWGRATAVNVTQKFAIGAVRSSVGFGVEWISPVGPIGLVWALPIHKVNGDVEKTIEFMLGGTF